MVEIYESKEGEWRFRIKARNGEIVAVGEGYTRKQDAIRGYETLLRLMRDGLEIVIN